VTDRVVAALLDELAADPAAVDRLRELVDAGAPEPWVGVAQAAEHLGCKPQRIYNLVADRAIPFRKDGSRLLFRRSELDAWLER
jgi:excisionase family DNA binding protein